MSQPQSTGPSHFQRVIVIPAYLDVIDTAGGKPSVILQHCGGRMLQKWSIHRAPSIRPDAWKFHFPWRNDFRCEIIVCVRLVLIARLC
jgi:hypothetical protein